MRSTKAKIAAEIATIMEQIDHGLAGGRLNVAAADRRITARDQANGSQILGLVRGHRQARSPEVLRAVALACRRRGLTAEVKDGDLLIVIPRAQRFDIS